MVLRSVFQAQNPLLQVEVVWGQKLLGQRTWRDDCPGQVWSCEDALDHVVVIFFTTLFGNFPGAGQVDDLPDIQRTAHTRGHERLLHVGRVDDHREAIEHRLGEPFLINVVLVVQVAVVERGAQALQVDDCTGPGIGVEKSNSVSLVQKFTNDGFATKVDGAGEQDGAFDGHLIASKTDFAVKLWRMIPPKKSDLFASIAKKSVKSIKNNKTPSKLRVFHIIFCVGLA